MGLARYLSLIGAVLLLGGCGGSSELDASKAEREIAAGVEERTATEGVQIDCPDGVERKKDAVFECELTAEGGLQAKVKVTQVDDEGNLRWEVNP